MAEMPSRPFQDDFIRFFCRISSPDPETREEARRLHRVRMDAWSTRRNIQKEWFAKAGLDAAGRHRRLLLNDKHAIECELMGYNDRPRQGHRLRLSQSARPSWRQSPAAARSRDSELQ